MKKVALVTGASTGLGISISIQLAAKGYAVYATMRNLEKKSQLQEAAETAGVSLEIKQLDVQDTASVDRCVSEIVNIEGSIDVLVNNAGSGFIRSTEQATEEDIQWVMDVNFMGVVRCTKAVMPHMRKQRSGHIVNISSFRNKFFMIETIIKNKCHILTSFFTNYFSILSCNNFFISFF